MRAVGNARYQRMSIWQVEAFIDQPVGTAFWHPMERIKPIRRQHDTIGDEFLSVSIIQASTGFAIQQLASDIGVIDFLGVDILELQHAAFAAAIA